MELINKYPNFFENHDEAIRRLNNTVVSYDGEPYYVVAITNVHPDGIFRMYLHPIGKGKFYQPPILGVHPNSTAIAPAIDEWLKTPQGTQSGIIRKKMDSPKFNKFRPFPMGMYNDKGRCCYIERQPNRKVEQGLINSMLDVHLITLGDYPGDFYGRESIELFSSAFRSCVLGTHPTAQECLTNLLNPKISNSAAGFHRNFALVRGPIEMMFLAYKKDIVGLLPDSDFSRVKLGREFQYVREAVGELNLFNDIV